MRRTIVLKCWPTAFQDIVNGVKRFEARTEDGRKFAVGDRLLLREWSPGQQDYTGQEHLVDVLHMLTGAELQAFGHRVPDSLRVMSIRSCTE